MPGAPVDDGASPGLPGHRGNRLTELNTQLVTGREAIFFGYEFTVHAFKQLPDYAVRYYIDNLTYRRDALLGSFGWYRALDTTIAQNEQRKTRPLTLPVLAIGGAESLGEGPADSMKLAADNVQAMVIPGCGHWVAEEAPEQMLAALTAFLARTGPPPRLRRSRSARSSAPRRPARAGSAA